jgi:hypothetical protein
MVSKDEWEAILIRGKHRCAFCGKTEKQVGELQKAHLKSRGKGGSQVIPLCPNCHKKYDTGKATNAQLKKIGVDPSKYKRMKPPKGRGEGSRDPVKSFSSSVNRNLRDLGF